jgi:hypothetical protein
MVVTCPSSKGDWAVRCFGVHVAVIRKMQHCIVSNLPSCLEVYDNVLTYYACHSASLLYAQQYLKIFY